MLHRGDMNALTVGEHGRERGLDTVAPIGPDLGAGIGSSKHDAAVRRGRTQRHRDRLPAMQPNPPTSHNAPQRPLRRNPHFPQHAQPV
jgi:hypothetical protein